MVGNHANVHRITNFVIVEITPIGIQNIGWKFWIIWTVFNAAFLPVIYFFYPETGKPGPRFLVSPGDTNSRPIKANRTLEDVDSYYRSNPSLVVVNDPDAVCVKRPQKYIQHEDNEMQKIQGIQTTKADNQMIEHVE